MDARIMAITDSSGSCAKCYSLDFSKTCIKHHLDLSGEYVKKITCDSWSNEPDKKCRTCVELEKGTCLLWGHAMGNPDSMTCDGHHSKGPRRGYQGSAPRQNLSILTEKPLGVEAIQLAQEVDRIQGKKYTVMDFGGCLACGKPLGIMLPPDYAIERYYATHSKEKRKIHDRVHTDTAF